MLLLGLLLTLSLLHMQVVDRPKQASVVEGRSYVQPQWVLDSANFRVRADERLYAPGVTPPPHLSPFVEAGEEDYVPDYARTMQQLQVRFLSCALLVLICVLVTLHKTGVRPAHCLPRWLLAGKAIPCGSSSSHSHVDVSLWT